ncbi:MAG: S8 family serine peptidase, partial [Nitrospinae bacterium]|nr:S8 family serine peptidase [Nitrospinota bacterium]
MKKTYAVIITITFILSLGKVSFALEIANKISPRVQKQLTLKKRIPVIILGKTQLLGSSNALAFFKKYNRHKKRSELRKNIVENLKKIAQREQKKIISEMNIRTITAQLWIVNAIAANLTAEEIDKIATNKSVKYIYGDRHKPQSKKSNEGVSYILKRQEVKEFSTEGKTIPWNIKAVKAHKVWSELNILGKGVTIAMLDTGVNYLHSDLQQNTWRNPGEIPNNKIDDDKNGLIDDYYGYNFKGGTAKVIAQGKQKHGTHTSGIIAGDGSGGILTGIAPESQLMYLIPWGSLVHTALSFQYALEKGADIVNMSFSLPKLNQERGFMRTMSEHALIAGLVQVSGAGNFGTNSKHPEKIPVQLRTPEDIPSVIAVGGVNKQFKLASFSSTGPVEWGSVPFFEDYSMPKGLIKPDIVAFSGPGYPLLQVTGSLYTVENNSIAGNSLSAPHV